MQGSRYKIDFRPGSPVYFLVALCVLKCDNQDSFSAHAIRIPVSTMQKAFCRVLDHLTRFVSGWAFQQILQVHRSISRAILCYSMPILAISAQILLGKAACVVISPAAVSGGRKGSLSAEQEQSTKPPSFVLVEGCLQTSELMAFLSDALSRHKSRGESETPD